MEILNLTKVKFNPLVFDGQTYHFVSTLSRKLRGSFFNNMMDDLHRLPEGLFCGASENEHHKRQDLLAMVLEGTITKDEAKTLFETFRGKQPARMTVADYIGDINPLNWATNISDEITLGFQLYGIRILSGENKNFSVRCNVWPILFSKNKVAFDSLENIQTVATVIRGALNTIIISEDRGVQIKVDVVDLMPITTNINTNETTTIVEPAVKLLLDEVSDVQVVPFARFGKDYHIYVRVEDGVSERNIPVRRNFRG